MTNEEIRQAARQQSAIDLHCRAQDFSCGHNVVVLSQSDPAARRYLELPFACNLVSYGDNIVASVSEGLRDVVTTYINRYPAEHCFETPHMHVLDDQLRPAGFRICFMAEYFLPDMTVLGERPCPFAVRLLEPAQFQSLYTPQWSNALCAQRRELDVLAAGAFDGETLVGLAGCSADCGTMWQIGIDVLPAYRRRGIAAALTSRLALEILRRDRIPFYCAAWSNLKSVRNAFRSGFRPAWVEMTAKSLAFVQNMNA